MNSTTGKLIQILATVLQVLNATNVSQLPPKWQAGFTGLLSTLQAITGVVQHYSTPAGNSISGVTGKVTATDGSTVGNVPTTKQ